MLEHVLAHLRNWFVVPGGVHRGTYTIKGGSITLPFLQTGQYFRICGSVFNDGVYQYPNLYVDSEDGTWPTDETFAGEIWALAVPRAVADLAAEIEAWEAKNGAVSTGPYQSESFGGYSYTKTTDAHTGGAVTWQSAFRSRLNQWRKI